MSKSIPTLLILFNRPDYALQLIDKLRSIGPDKLFVAIDGPRESVPQDSEAVRKCVDALDTIDWPCTIHKRISDTNIGCGKNVSGAISWFLSEVEEGIILEDDCIPSEAFYDFCKIMLHKYRDTPKVMMVSGNRWNQEFSIVEDYFFSIHTSTWGWATWRRAWQLYDYKMSDWLSEKKNPEFLNWLNTPSAKTFWLDKLDQYYRRLGVNIDNWDFQWQYTLFKNKGMVLTPKENLVQNVGVEGVHTYSTQKNVHFQPVADKYLDLYPPNSVKPNRKFDEYHCLKLINSQPTIFSKLFFGLKQLSSMNLVYLKRQISKFF